MTDLIRCFIAIEIPETIKNKIEAYIKDLHPFAPKIKWASKNALHVTLKFLGHQTPQNMEKIITALLLMKQNHGSFEITVSESGAFPAKKRPRVIWLGIQPVPRETFLNLYAWIEERLSAIGIEPEERNFSPHLTLARVKFPQDFSSMWQYMEQNPFGSQTFQVHEIVLMRSILKSSGAEYQVIQKYPLHP